MANGKNLMTIPVLANRCPVFAPSIKAGKTNWSVTTPYGSVSVMGDITQTHHNILDAIFGFALDSRTFQSGAVEVLVDPFIVTSKTGSCRDYKWLDSVLEDMKKSMVRLKDNNGGEHVGGIVSEWRKTKEKGVVVPLPGGCMKGVRTLLAVTISAAWMRLYNTTLTVGYRDLIPAISALKSGVAQALVRFCLTHRVVNMKLDEVLQHIGAIEETTKQANPRKYNRVHKIVAEADLTLFGIEIKNRVVTYRQHDLVRFKNGNQDTICAGEDTICAGEDTICAGEDTICAASQEFQERQELLDDGSA
jgi:hypothetical protein